MSLFNLSENVGQTVSAVRISARLSWKCIMSELARLANLKVSFLTHPPFVLYPHLHRSRGCQPGAKKDTTAHEKLWARIITGRRPSNVESHLKIFYSFRKKNNDEGKELADVCHLIKRFFSFTFQVKKEELVGSVIGRVDQGQDVSFVITYRCGFT